MAERYVRNSECVSCKSMADKAYALANAEKVAEGVARWKENNPTASREYAARYYLANKVKCAKACEKWARDNQSKIKAAVAANVKGRKASAKKYRSANPHIVRASQARRRALLLKATASWADQEEIRRIYEMAIEAGMHVDHVIPLRGARVCGLHVETNLRLLPPRVNLAKGNRFDEALV